MSVKRHCDWCKTVLGFRAKIAVNDDQWHFCSYAHAKSWFERQEAIYEISDRDAKLSYWADQKRIEADD